MLISTIALILVLILKWHDSPVFRHKKMLRHGKPPDFLVKTLPYFSRAYNSSVQVKSRKSSWYSTCANLLRIRAYGCANVFCSSLLQEHWSIVKFVRRHLSCVSIRSAGSDNLFAEATIVWWIVSDRCTVGQPTGRASEVCHRCILRGGCAWRRLLQMRVNVDGFELGSFTYKKLRSLPLCLLHVRTHTG